MSIDAVISLIDVELARLNSARNLLTSIDNVLAPVVAKSKGSGKRGRPKGSKYAPKPEKDVKQTAKKMNETS